MKIKSLISRILFVLSVTIIFSSGHIENPDTHLRLTQARSLVEERSFEVEKGYGDVSHGNLAVNKKGQQFSVYNPGQILLFVPIYAFSKYVSSNQGEAYYTAAFLASFLGYLIFGSIILLFWEFGKKLSISEKQRLLATFLFAFTSYCFAHAQDSYEHIYEALFLLISIRIAYSCNSETKSILLSAVSLGLGMLFRTSILISLPGLLLILKTWKARVMFLLFLSPFFLPLLYYNFMRFGDPLENGYAIAWFNAFGQTPSSSFNLLYLPKNIVGLLISFGKGLLIFSPSLLLLFGCIKRFIADQRRLCLSILLISFTYIAFYAANFAWHGSAWNWGPRYIVPIVPLLYLGLFYIPLKKRQLILSLGTLSLVIQVLAVSTFYKRELIKSLQRNGDIFWSDIYFFSPSHSPIVGQWNSFLEVTKSMSSNSQKELFIPDGPWRNESRPASQEDMLRYSIDLTVYNFWWVRILYMKVSIGVKVASLILVALASLTLLLKTKTLWKHIKEKRIGQFS